MLLKILTTIFVAFISLKVLRKFKERSLGFFSSFFSIAILISLLIVVFDPQISDKIAHLFGIQRGTDIAFFTAILILIYLVFKLYAKTVALDKDLTTLTTRISIKLHNASKENGADKQ